YSYSKRSSMAIHPSSQQITVNRFDQPSVSQKFKQPSSTSTVALSTASLSTSTKQSDAMHEFSIYPQQILKNQNLLCPIDKEARDSRPLPLALY
ncbi:MAG: hypothetical protein ACKN9S_12095, partial [Pirellula sp.]